MYITGARRTLLRYDVNNDYIITELGKDNLMLEKDLLYTYIHTCMILYYGNEIHIIRYYHILVYGN